MPGLDDEQKYRGVVSVLKPNCNFKCCRFASTADDMLLHRYQAQQLDHMTLASLSLLRRPAQSLVLFIVDGRPLLQ